MSPWAALLAALALTLLCALLVGSPSLRLKGHYLAMATLGFGIIVYKLVHGSRFTGASDGVTAVPPLDLGFGLRICGGDDVRVRNYYFAWGLALAVMVVLQNLVRSRVGRALRSIHGGEAAANAMGVDTEGYKLKVFVLSAALAGGGSLPDPFLGRHPPPEARQLSVRYVALAAAGGMANLWGAGVSTLLNFLSCAAASDVRPRGLRRDPDLSWPWRRKDL